ncbi:PDZ and LIM domain protein Zasp-like isoform X3 [Frankliniella occidentalis]|uniref:PDZ and LIM domain protein Zasp-like isoform X3 n=1 Tax=Frankliniella occidentalis TaxID=133901 RepID=A0A9C6X4R9_FRAOC|nr:PDZ and LIM domain protein Zasp-like isoform X3 [Frankliniella occidentalis]
MAQLISVKLSRYDNSPWGFRLQGGKDFGTPLIIQKVNGGSPAEKAGLQAGDAVLRINNIDATALRHKDAQDCIVRAGNNYELAIQRGAGRRADNVVGAAQMNGGPDKQIVNKQFNSPIGIYSEQAIAETLSAQAEVLTGGAIGVNFKKNEKEYNSANSEVLKMVQEADKEPRIPEPERPASTTYFATHSHAVGGRACSPAPGAAPRPLTPSHLAPGSPAPGAAPSAPSPVPSSSFAPSSPDVSGLPVAPETPKCSECERFIV